MPIAALRSRASRLVRRVAFKAGVGLPGWRDVERFDDVWKKRIAQMAALLDEHDSVVDFGCGPMWLKAYVDPAKYVGIDYVDRGEGMIVCDLNDRNYPDVKGDAAFISGCLEYIEDVDSFLDFVAARFRKCVLSYCTLDEFPDRHERLSLAWKNSLTRDQVVEHMVSRGYTVIHEDKTETRYMIFRFENIVTP